MKTTLVTLFVVVFLAPFGLFAQTQETTEPQTPASREDLREVAKELQESIRKSERRTAVQAEQDRVKAEQERLEAVKHQQELLDKANLALSSATETQAELARRTAAQEEAAKLEEVKTRQFIFWGLAFVAVLMIAIGFWNRKRHVKVQVLTAIKKAEDETVPAMLQNPSVAELRNFAKKYNLEKFMTVLTLQDGREGICHAWVHPNNGPCQAQIEGDPNPEWIDWEDRRKRASKIFPALAKK